MVTKNESIEIKIEESFFLEKEKLFIEFGNLKAFLFKYDTGIPAIKIENPQGHIILLPYNGQMIWDAVFNGRSIKMHTQFEKPRPASHFFETYGCYLMYCGARRAGCPGPEDTHPLHGELPYVKYDEASFIIGEDESSKYIGLTGTYEYNMAFGDKYSAQPTAKLYEDNTLIDVSMTINNLINTPMELMFMYHVNYFPGGRIVQSCDWNNKDMKVRLMIPEHAKNFLDGYLDFLYSLKDHPEKSKVILPEHIYDPEICFELMNMKTDKDGYTYFMQVLDDGSGDYVKYKPSELDCCTRWISKTPNHQTLGMALPATCGSEGYLEEKKKGNIKIIPPHGTFKTAIQAGYIAKEKVSEIEKFIENL